MAKMGNKRTKSFVEGMTCSSSEARIGTALRRTNGVIDAKASQKGGTARVDYDDSKVSVDTLSKVDASIGYGMLFVIVLLPRRFVQIMVRASAVPVMFLGAVTFARAASLARVARRTTGVNPALLLGTKVSDPADPGPLVAPLSDGTQSITTTFAQGLYLPFVAQAGVPLGWTIRVTADDLNDCSKPVTFQCSMGMLHSFVKTVDNLAKVDMKKIKAEIGAYRAVSAGGGRGGYCGRQTSAQRRNPEPCGGGTPTIIFRGVCMKRSVLILGTGLFAIALAGSGSTDVVA
jgi:copper chaperone CopZ